MSDYYDNLVVDSFRIYSNETQALLYWLYKVTEDVYFARETPEFIISLIGVFLNIFHLIILTRKSMRSTSINVLMIGIAFSDLVTMMCAVYNPLLYLIKSECSPPRTYFLVVLEEVVNATKDTFRRLSAWLGVPMAVIRFLIIKNPLNPRFDILSRSSFSWKISSVIAALSFSFILADWFKTQVEEDAPWIPPDHCTGFPENFTSKSYFAFLWLKEEEDFVYLEIMMTAKGVLKIIPAILLPILASLLIRELKAKTTARRKLSVSQNIEASQTDHITKLVILMTVSSILTEGPLGIAYAVGGHFSSQESMFNYAGLISICYNITASLEIFVSLNANAHCLICMAMSSQYRNCVKSLFCRKVTVEPVKVAPNVISMTSVRNVVVQI